MRRVLITGGASGIGAACVRRFQDDGCSVAVLDRDARRRRGRGVRRSDAATSATRRRSAAAVDEAAAALGGLDVVVAAAGIAARGTVADTDPADWDRVLAVNLRGVYLTGRAAIPHLRAAGGGAIVNIASQLGLVAAANAAAYCASKGAVISLTRAMAIDHGPEGIRVNCVCPGPTDTPLLEPYFGAAADPAAERRAYEAMQLHARLVTADEDRRRGGLPRRARLELDDGRRARRRWGVHRSDDRPSGRRQRRDRHAGRPLARRGRARVAVARARAARLGAHRGRRSTTSAGARGRRARASMPRRAGRRTSCASTSSCICEFYEAGIAEVTARDRYAGMLVGKHLAGHLPPALRHAGRAQDDARAGGPGHGRRVRRARRGALPRLAARARRLRRGVLAQLRAAAGLRPALAVALQGRPRRHGEHADRRCRTTGARRSRRRPRGCALSPYPLASEPVHDLRAGARRCR